MPDSPDHTAAPGMWSYSCRCLRCRWEQWWNEQEADEPAVSMPDEPHPDDPERYPGASNTGIRPDDA